MTILEALQAGHIRFSDGEIFTADKLAGRFWQIRSQAGLAKILAGEADKYVGAEFVRFDQQLPDSIPLAPEHCWAMQGVDCQTEDWKPIGAIVVWSTADREDEVLSARMAEDLAAAENFHFLRSSGIEDRA